MSALIVPVALGIAGAVWTRNAMYPDAAVSRRLLTIGAVVGGAIAAGVAALI